MSSDGVDASAELRKRLATSSFASASSPDLPSFRRRTSRLSLDSQIGSGNGLLTPERTPSPSPLDDQRDELPHRVGFRTPGGSDSPEVVDAQYAYTSSPDTPRAPGRYTNERAWRASSPTSDVSEMDSVQAVATPSNLSSSVQRRRSARDALRQLPTSLLDYLANEVRIADPDETSSSADPDADLDAKAERITNFLSVPAAVERVIWVGMLICLDAFLHTFTILPLRFSLACYRLVDNLCGRLRDALSSSGSAASPVEEKRRRRLPTSSKVDLVKGALVLLSCAVLHRITDASQMYHSVRGQDNIKLYVIFNVLEIADRLCCSFGQDLLDSLFSRSTLGRRRDGTQPRLRPAALFSLCVAYVCTLRRSLWGPIAHLLAVAHTLVLFYQLVTLNVAVNYYSNMLLTLLLSNQFTEIKSAVFKKFEKENLFQMSCADIVERFQLSLLLCVIALRNLIELSGSTFAMLPASYIPLSVVPSLAVLQRTVSPALIVLMSEMLVDWLKHAFITKFNHIRPAVYGRFIDVLCKDLLGRGSDAGSSAFVDQSPAVSRRLGFAAIPLGCLVVRVIFQAATMLTDTSHIDECAPMRRRRPIWVWPAAERVGFGADRQVFVARWGIALAVALAAWSFLILIKLLLGIYLRAYASSRLAGMPERALEDRRNARSRQPIGVTATERDMDDMARDVVSSPVFDAPGKLAGRLESSINSPQNVVSMENLSRFDLVKSRLW